MNLTKLPTPSEFVYSERNKPSYYRGPRLEQSPDLGLELDMENIKDVHNKEQGLMVMGDRERKFSDSSGSSPSTSVSCSPKVCDCIVRTINISILHYNLSVRKLIFDTSDRKKLSKQFV